MYCYKLSDIAAVAAGVPDEGRRLAVLDLLLRDRLDDSRRATQRRRAHLRQIVELAEGGQIAIVTSGMDCDCSAWTGSVSYVPATVAAVDEWLEDFYGNAEGPQGHYLAAPSVARRVQRTSRDLALEAYEDGHPHVVHY